MCVCVCVCSRVLWVDVVDGHPSLNGTQGKPSRLVLLVLEDSHSAMLVFEGTIEFLQRACDPNMACDAEGIILYQQLCVYL